MAERRGRHVPADPLEPSRSDRPFRAVTVRLTTGHWQLCVSLALSLSLALRTERAAKAAAWSGFLTHPALFNASEGVWVKESTADRHWMTGASHAGCRGCRGKENNSLIPSSLQYPQLKSHPQGLPLDASSHLVHSLPFKSFLNTNLFCSCFPL